MVLSRISHACFPTILRGQLDARIWDVPPILQWLKRAGALEDAEFARTFNAGLGMVLVVPTERVKEMLSKLKEAGEKAWKVGQLVERGEGEGCVVEGMDVWVEER